MELLRLGPLLGLALFYFLSGCSEKTQDSPVSILWVDSIPAGLIVSVKSSPSMPEDSVRVLLQVHLMHDQSTQPVAGEYSIQGNEITFHPLIPFTRALSYEVTLRGRVLDRIQIPPIPDSGAPSVLAVYPSADTVPENLLKMYISFSRPMHEMYPLSFVLLLRNGRDTASDAFLDLKPPLWNRESTMLTLWLDPGRIKRDLQPNQKSGPPMQDGSLYELIVLSSWMSKEGAMLRDGYSKKFYVRSRDGVSPDPLRWKIAPPEAGSTDTLKIALGEPLDYLLLREAMHLLDGESNRVRGEFLPGQDEAVLYFIPDNAWNRGKYLLRCESRLEDLAGNNLNRLFDRDITTDAAPVDKPFHEIPFTVGR